MNVNECRKDLPSLSKGTNGHENAIKPRFNSGVVDCTLRFCVLACALLLICAALPLFHVVHRFSARGDFAWHSIFIAEGSCEGS